jgi:hypothetical protein
VTDDEYSTTIDVEAIAHARRAWPDRARVRRVRINADEHTLPQHMAHERVNEEDENA